MMKKSCELCPAPARIYCDADRAALCWACDNAVHSANFLVARHSRNLLCHSCNSISDWRASGSELGRVLSVCRRCSLRVKNGRKGEDYEEIDVNDYFGDTEDETDDDDDNRLRQVVPSSTAPPPWTCSSSSNPESTISFSLKRKRGDTSNLSSPAPPLDDLCDKISSNYGCASTVAEDWSSGEDGAETEGQHTFVDSFRPAKKDMRSGGDSSAGLQPEAASFRRVSAELGEENGNEDSGSSKSPQADGFKIT